MTLTLDTTLYSSTKHLINIKGIRNPLVAGTNFGIFVDIMNSA